MGMSVRAIASPDDARGLKQACAGPPECSLKIKEDPLMNRASCNRRDAMRWLAAAAVGGLVGLRNSTGRSDVSDELHVACNQYPWFTFFRREQRDFNKDLNASLSEVAKSGVDGFEPLATSVQMVEQLAPLLEQHGLEMRSLYVNSVLHDSEGVEESIRSVLQIAGAAHRACQTRIIVTNPSPIRWGGSENKTDEQLETQAAALERLGRALSERGMVLAYHNHDVELRLAAREFHHMMVGTDPEVVKLCLDAHWIFRGAGDSSVALFDVVELYGTRIVELHLRQSQNGIWTESLGAGDIDYNKLAARLRELGCKPHLVVEQAVEKDSSNTMNALEAHRQSVDYTRRVFRAFAS